MQEFIARENIKRFRSQLAACTDPEQRKVLERLLDEEKKRLSEALGEKPETDSGASGDHS